MFSDTRVSGSTGTRRGRGRGAQPGRRAQARPVRARAPARRDAAQRRCMVPHARGARGAARQVRLRGGRRQGAAQAGAGRRPDRRRLDHHLRPGRRRPGDRRRHGAHLLPRCADADRAGSRGRGAAQAGAPDPASAAHRGEAPSTVKEAAHVLALLHRPADLRGGALDLHRARRPRRDAHAADRAVPGDRAAGGHRARRSIPAPPPRCSSRPSPRRSRTRSTASST